MWSAAGQRGEGGPDLVRRDNTHQRVLGDTALVTGVQAQTATYQGRDSSGRFRGTLVAVRREKQWSIVNLQLSMLAGLPGG
jgi:SnoaL-like domain